jgi:hypothetical protein
MKIFKTAAIKVLEEAREALHVREITKRALKNGYLVSDGKTPEATMNALLVVDVNKNGEKSIFEKVGPATFKLRHILKAENGKFRLTGKEVKLKRTWSVSDNISSKQKGDIAESRIAELLVLYGSESLSCYKPISDDDGIDIIAKKKKSTDSIFLQVKSRYGEGFPVSFTATVKTSAFMDHKHMAVVFCFFNTEEGDLSDYLWFVPAGDFIKKANRLLGGTMLGFVAGMNKKESNKWDQYQIEKKDLANKVIGCLNRI